ncbi:hypothetical protein [Campylobacter insulaenigrae]|uniref:hypothetical protein n=1 Tax=Campylobacter insulaenigrae TaxID=260714 RepID=UPI0021531521|nr:hypothetical protein [Campylobacter insulaenigrae]MCR6570540.1 hypothetical protein [Campylobacter insulaenigrae]MCR6581724.1 hypothetical protein [Campylobacter insulaenigrae]MCR6584621.1 hypothetical protein [Campylobacter insulaenigrae]
MQNELLQDLENHFETLNHIRNLAQNYDERLTLQSLPFFISKDIDKNDKFISSFDEFLHN